MENVVLTHEQLLENLKKVEKLEERINELNVEDQNLVTQIAEINNLIDNSKVIADQNQVTLGSTVTVKYDNEIIPETFKIVRTIIGNNIGGVVSINSPEGKAILGAREGDRYSFNVRDQIVSATVLKVVNEYVRKVEPLKTR